MIGTTYGGDGQTTFALPNLLSRIPLHQGQSGGTSTYVIGQNGGSEQVTLTGSQIPEPYPPGPVLHRREQQPIAGQRRLGPGLERPALQGRHDRNGRHGYAGAIGPAGGNQPHPNLMAYQALNYIIALEGIFPSQS